MIKYWSYADRASLTQYENFSLFIFPLFLAIILIAGIIAYIILEVSKKIDLKNSSIYNFFKISIISLFMIYIGFSTYSMIFIRAGQNPNINENDPSDKESFVKYMNREQYGVEHNNIDWFNILKYHLSNDGNETVFSEKFERPLQEEIKINSSFSGLDGSDNKQRWLTKEFQYYINENTRTFDLDKVSNEDILRFVKSYQINEMYLRYFGWQFIGKEYDKEKYTWSRSDSFKNKRILPLQDNSNLGNIDWFRYGLPFAFIFGMIGMIYHFVRDPKRALSILILFLATGIAIVLYLNQHDPQPRERDYSYVGSFFAFSIWIGIGCMSFFDFINYIFSAIKKDTANKSKSLILIPTVSIFLILLAVPLTYLIKDYSVHDRSGNYSAKDYGYNILAGCKSDSVIFTNGDNDTFPLWYAQEVEGIRTDIRVVNLSLFNTDWYIDQMKRAAYDAAPIPSSLGWDKYKQGTRDYLPIYDRDIGHVELSDVISFIADDSQKSKIPTSRGKSDYCPTNKVKLTVDKEKVLALGIVDSSEAHNIVDEVKWKIKGQGFAKNQLMVLDILANFAWERPIYFAITVGNDNFMGLDNYFKLEGLAYRFVPWC